MGNGDFKKRFEVAGIVASMYAMEDVVRERRRNPRVKQKICPVCQVIYPGQKKCCSKECFVKYKEMYDGK